MQRSFILQRCFTFTMSLQCINLFRYAIIVQPVGSNKQCNSLKNKLKLSTYSYICRIICIRVKLTVIAEGINVFIVCFSWLFLTYSKQNKSLLNYNSQSFYQAFVLLICITDRSVNLFVYFCSIKRSV